MYVPGVRNTDDCIHAFESSDEKFVGQNACCIFKAEETMVCEDGSNAHEVGMKYSFMTD